jgi:hypothetical protein
MSSIIRIKRSTGTVAPSNLYYGELGLTIGIGSHGNSGGRLFVGDNSGTPDSVDADPIAIGGRYYTDLLSIGPGLVDGQANPTTASNGFVAILDQNRKVNQWNVDNLTLDGNTISSTDVNGDINLDPNGTGRIKVFADIITDLTAFNLLNANVTTANILGAATALVLGAATGIATIRNATVDLDGDLNVDGGDVTSNTTSLNLFNTNVTTANVLGAGTNILFGAATGITTIRNATVDLDGDLNVDGGDVTSNTTALNLFNTNVTTANVLGAATALVVGAATGITTIRNATVDLDGDLNIDGGDVTSNTTALNLFNTNVTNANVLGAGTNIVIGATTGIATIRNPTVVGTQATQNLYNTVATNLNFAGAATALVVGATSGIATINNPTVVGTQATQNLYNTVATNLNFAGAATALVVGATTGIATIRNATVDLDGDLNVDGGDVTSNTAALNLFNATVTTANVLGAGTNILFGAATGITTIRNATLDLDGDLNVDGGDVTSNTAELNLFNATVTNANVLGAGTNIVIGATSGIATINNPTVVGTQATQNLYNTVATNLNFAGAATALVVGATSGIATIRNAILSVPNATTLNLGATSSVTSVNFQSTPNTSFVSIAATTNATTTTSGALRVAGGVGIVKDVYIGGILNVTGAQTNQNNLTVNQNLQVDGNTTLGSESTDTITITGVLSHTGPLTNTGGATIDNIGISSNVISTKSGGGNVLYIDPYPDGLSNQGLVIIKGDLQVDGTTTTVDSSSVTVNGSIISLGDVTSNRTVVVAVASGVSTITLDSVVGINTGDIISGNAALPNSGLTTITAYNTSTKIVTITGATSSGITSTTQLTITHAYDTNTDRGISFDYNTGVGTANQKSGFFGFDDSTGRFTYVPDASISNSVVSGTKGYLDIKGIYYQSGDFSTHGVVYFDSTGLQNSTNDPASPTITSKQILTAVTEANITLSGLTTVTVGDIILQNTGGAYGIVKTSVASTSIITLIGVEGTFNTTNNSILLKNGSNIGIGTTAIVASVVYTNKPMWTSTLDGGTF